MGGKQRTPQAPPPECPHPSHASPLRSFIAFLLEQGLAGLLADLFPLLETGPVGSSHVSAGAGGGRGIGLGPISGAPGLGVTTVMLHRARNPAKTRAGLGPTRWQRGRLRHCRAPKAAVGWRGGGKAAALPRLLHCSGGPPHPLQRFHWRFPPCSELSHQRRNPGI